MKERKDKEEAITTMSALKKRGIFRKTLDLDVKTPTFYDGRMKRFHASSGVNLMQTILNNLATHKNADAIIQDILYPPK